VIVHLETTISNSEVNKTSVCTPNVPVSTSKGKSNSSTIPHQTPSETAGTKQNSDQTRSKDTNQPALVNGDAKQLAGNSSVSSSGPPVVSITSGQPFMEAPNNNSSKQSGANDGKHLSYAQITQKKKEEREAKEAADRAAAAGASYNSNQSSVDVICGIEDSSKKNIKEQVAVKQNVHGVSTTKDADHIKSSVIFSQTSGSSSLKSNSPASDCSKVPGTTQMSSVTSSISGPKHSKGANNSTSGNSTTSGSSSGKKIATGSTNNYSKRSSSRGKSPPIVSAAISNVASNQASNANTDINSSSGVNQPLANSSSSGASQKVVSSNPSGAVQINSSTSIVSAATTK